MCCCHIRPISPIVSCPDRNCGLVLVDSFHKSNLGGTRRSDSQSYEQCYKTGEVKRMIHSKYVNEHVISRISAIVSVLLENEKNLYEEL